MGDRVILHCDLNCFFASVELLSHPDLRDIPTAVCGDPASRHGIILAKNEPAKRLGIQTAETIWQAKKKCPGLVLLPPHHGLYREYSRRVNAIYEQYTDLVEPFGIDESVAGIAGCSKVELAQSTVTLELGDELSENVEDYLQNPDEKILKGASLDLSAVDETKVGSYNAAVAYDGKNYPFTVEVKDTTSPQCEAKDYIYMQPGTLTMDDLVTEIKDASETSSGIVSCEQKEDLVVCDYDDMLQEKAVVDTTDSYDGADYQESVQLDDEGCYEVTAQVKDSEGNFTDITLNVYVDGTAPELAQNVIDLDVDASGISIDDINTDDAEKIADMLHELPDFTDAEWAVASDAFCQDNKISYEFEQKSFNLQKENPVEVLNVHCTVQDQAGNENEADYEVMVTYTGLDAEALLEKTGLIMQIADTSYEKKKENTKASEQTPEVAENKDTGNSTNKII